MTTKEALLVKVMEECDELSQRCSKALRFTLEEIQPGQELTNAQRIVEEARDLSVALQLLVNKDYIPRITPNSLEEFDTRKERIETYLNYSRKLGTVID